MEERGIMPPQPRQPPAIAFLDLTGYTALAEDRGDQAAAELAADLASVVQEAAQEHGGRPVKWLGDGVMFHFADPGRAILGGLDLVEQTQKAVSVPARIGINAGTVIAQEGDYFGRTVNIAARIADYARPHEVLVSEQARKRKPERCRLRADRRRTAQGRLELGEAAQGGPAVSEAGCNFSHVRPGWASTRASLVAPGSSGQMPGCGQTCTSSQSVVWATS
jgi:class 3 adenylate cyclase